MEKGSKDADSFERELEREGRVDIEGDLHGYSPVRASDEEAVEPLRVPE